MRPRVRGWMLTCLVVAGAVGPATPHNPDLLPVLSDGRADAHVVSALLLAGDEHVPVQLRATVTKRSRPLLRVTAVGDVTTEVTIDELNGRQWLRTMDRPGATKSNQSERRWSMSRDML